MPGAARSAKSANGLHGHEPVMRLRTAGCWGGTAAASCALPPMSCGATGTRRMWPRKRFFWRFAAWLFQIVVRLCLDRKRTARWKREVPADTVPPAVHHDSHDTRLLIAALLDHLTPPMRAALVLREVEGLEYDEIAAALSIPVGTVRSRLSTARAQFRSLWTAAQNDPTQEDTLHV